MFHIFRYFWFNNANKGHLAAAKKGPEESIYVGVYFGHRKNMRR